MVQISDEDYENFKDFWVTVTIKMRGATQKQAEEIAKENLAGDFYEVKDYNWICDRCCRMGFGKTPRECPECSYEFSDD